MFEEPEIHIIDFSSAGNDYRSEARRRYLARVEAELIRVGLDGHVAPAWSEAILDCLFKVLRLEGGEPCLCSCHPHLPDSDFHDYGFGCSCQQTAQQRRRSWEEAKAEMDAYWDSPAGQEVLARRRSEEDQLVAWLAGQPDVVVTSYGGCAPEQWGGTVEGRKFYFRERHGDWRIEFDLRPIGRFSKVWKGGSLDDEANFELREIEEGDVIAEGQVGVAGYGQTPVERAQFIVRTIREHIGRMTCEVHEGNLGQLSNRLGVEVRWCPACGARI